MQNPILAVLKKVTKKDMFNLFGLAYKWLSPWVVKQVLISMLKDKLFDRVEVNEPVLKTDLAGISLPNPIGLSAGFDDKAEIIDDLCHLGLGFGELGTYTLKKNDTFQTSRFYRKIKSIFYLNNGYHNYSCKEVASKLASRRGRKNIVGVSIGEGRSAKDAAEEIVKCIPVVAPYADFLVLNISTPDYSEVNDYSSAKIIQNELRLHDMLVRAKELVSAAVLNKCPIFVKVPSDIPLDAKRVLVERCFSAGIDGLIVSGPVLKVPEGVLLKESDYGGFFCGKSIREDVNNLVKEYYYLSAGRLPIISTGGILNGKDAYARIRAGASLVQIYSALIYDGPAIIPTILKELAALLKADGFENVKDAVGADLRK